MKNKLLPWLGALAVFALFGFVGHLDLQDQQAAEEHAKHVKQLARIEAADRKIERDYLMAKANWMTNSKGIK
jgi:hypothetical protein